MKRNCCITTTVWALNKNIKNRINQQEEDWFTVRGLFSAEPWSQSGIGPRKCTKNGWTWKRSRLYLSTDFPG